MDACRHDQLPMAADVCADDAAVLALSIARFIASGYATSEVACWDAAYTGAEKLLGEIEGGALVGALTRVMRAMRSERAADWSFMPATCCRITFDEQELVALLQIARLGPEGRVASAAAQLARVPDAPRLTRAVLSAAAILERIQHHLATAHQGRPPRPAAYGLH